MSPSASSNKLKTSKTEKCPESFWSDLARKGNGQDQELSREQIHLIHQLFERVASHREALPSADKEFCDLETCRRYLVARQWDLNKAERQLVATLKWRKEEEPGSKQFCESPKPRENPLALSMRVVGWDSAGRPLGYTCFAEAHDRWDAEMNAVHVQLLLEACQTLIRQRRKRGLNRTAASRQCNFVVDFDGFCFRDQDPRTAITVAHLLQHFPEMMHLIVLIDAPVLFNGVFRLISPLLDERVRSKIVFVKGSEAGKLLKRRLGQEAAQWIENETRDNKERRVAAKKGNDGPKKYWVEPEYQEQHNPRGIESYLDSDLYIKTPGDAYEETKRAQNKTDDNNRVRVSTIMSGTVAPDFSVALP